MSNKPTIYIRHPELEDEKQFLAAVQRSRSLHHNWVKVPETQQEFKAYYHKFQQTHCQSYFIFDKGGDIAGVFNISEIVYGLFQSAYLGFYVFADFAEKGYMSEGLKLVLGKIFNELKLHRIEANIQPHNFPSISLVKKNGFRYEGFSPRYLKINNEWCGHERWAMTMEDFIKNDILVLEKDHVDLIAYHTRWPEMAKQEIKKIRETLPLNKIIDIQHVGSTAIPDIAAKPIIDIQIAVKSLEEMKVIAIPALQKLGYEYWAENPDTTRMFFVKGMPPFGEKRSHHIHISEQGSSHWCDKIIFRDYLLTHPETAKDYEKLKQQLANEYKYDREKYTDAKREFITQILKLARDEHI